MSYKNIDEYIQTFPQSTQKILQKIRVLIQKITPQAVEAISYQMPAFKLNGKALVYFAGYDHHIGFYATPTGHKEFEKELSKYKQGKGSVQFPLDLEIPYDLIKRIVEYRVENSNKKVSKNQAEDWISLLSKPAQRALNNAGINTSQQLSTWTKEDLLKLHGFGPSSLPKIIKYLKK